MILYGRLQREQVWSGVEALRCVLVGARDGLPCPSLGYLGSVRTICGVDVPGVEDEVVYVFVSVVECGETVCSMRLTSCKDTNECLSYVLVSSYKLKLCD